MASAPPLVAALAEVVVGLGMQEVQPQLPMPLGHPSIESLCFLVAISLGLAIE